MSRDGSVETWPTHIESPEDLAAEYRSPVREVFSEFPYCVRTPPEHVFHESFPEQILCLGGMRLALFRRRRGVVSSIVFGLDAIDALESETTLLASRLRVYPRGGTPFSVPYNSVGAALFKPFVAAFKDARGSKVAQGERLEALRPNPFHYLVTRDYRYHSYVAEVLPDDFPKAHFYHPVTAVPTFISRHRIISAYLLVASPSLLYLLSEEPPLRSSRQAEYSVMFRYLPCSAGVSFGIEEDARDERFQMLSLHVGRTTFTVPLALRQREAFDAFEQEVPRCQEAQAT